jgi:hypothetical protein
MTGSDRWGEETVVEKNNERWRKWLRKGATESDKSKVREGTQRRGKAARRRNTAETGCGSARHRAKAAFGSVELGPRTSSKEREEKGGEAVLRGLRDAKLGSSNERR